MTNNQVEAYNLLIGTKILKKNQIKDPIIIGDSTIIIAAMEAGKELKNAALNKIRQRILDNKKNMEKVVFKHVLRTQNKEADSLANKAMDRRAGMVKEGTVPKGTTTKRNNNRRNNNQRNNRPKEQQAEGTTGRMNNRRRNNNQKKEQ